MPYQIQLFVHDKYTSSKNNWLYSFIYNIKYLFSKPSSSLNVININIANTIYDVIYETIEYLVMNDFIKLDSFTNDTSDNNYDDIDDKFLRQVLYHYEFSDKSIDEENYTKPKFIQFLVNQAEHIDDIHTLCLKYGDQYELWYLNYEFTE